MAIARERDVIQVARLVEVHLHAFEHFVEHRLGQPIGLRVRLERLGHGVGWRTVEHLGELIAPPGQLLIGHAGVLGVVHDIVDLPAPGIEGGNGPPPLGRQEQEAVIEAGAALRGFFLAILIGRHAGLGSVNWGVLGAFACAVAAAT